MLLVGIDLGTSSVKTEVYTEDGSLVKQGYSLINKQEYHEWLNAIHVAIPVSILREYPHEKIVSIDSTSGTIIFIDEYGNPLYPPIMYYETATKYYELIKDLDSVRELNNKGNIISSSSPIVKILRIKEEKPEVFEKTRWIVPPTTWLLYKLVIPEGEKWEDITIDYTNALKFGVDITAPKLEWFKPLFEETKIPLEKFPKIREPGDFIGEARSKLARELGLYKSSVYHGMTDGNAAALAGGVIKPGDLGIYSGSTTVLKYATSSIVPHQALYYHRHPLGGYLASLSTGHTGEILSWFSRKVFGIEVSEALEYAKNIEPGSEFLFFPPGDRSPFNNPRINAVLASIKPVDAGRDIVIGTIIRSIVLGIIFVEYSLIRLLENVFNTHIEEVNLSGGGVKDRYWNVIRASIYMKPVNVYGERIAVGALIPAILKSGLYKKVEDVKYKFLHVVDRLYPEQSLSNIYGKIAKKYMEKWSILQTFYDAI